MKYLDKTGLEYYHSKIKDTIDATKNRHCITASSSADGEVVNAFGTVAVVLDTQVAKTGEKLTISNGNVVVDSGVSKIRVSGLIYGNFTNNSSSTEYQIAGRFIKNGEALTSVRVRDYVEPQETKNMTIVLSPIEMEVTENDTINIGIYSESQNVTKSITAGSYILVEACDSLHEEGSTSSITVNNTETESTTDTYSCDYINTQLEPLANKQDALTAGDNITIVDNVISATGGSGVNNRNCITAMTSVDSSKTSVAGATPLLLDYEVSKTGDKLTISDGNILVGSGINKVRVSGLINTFFKNTTPNNRTVGVSFMHNGEIVTPNIIKTISTITYATVDIMLLSPIEIEVNEGDTVNIGIYTLDDQVEKHAGAKSYITVEAIESLSENGGGSSSVNVTNETTDSTTDVYSTNYINSQLATKQDALTAGDNITIVDNVISATPESNVNVVNELTNSTTDVYSTEYVNTQLESLNNKQDALTAGDNITIVDNVISASAGNSVNVVNDKSESTTDVYSTDYINDQLVQTFKLLGSVNTINQLPPAADPATKPESSEEEEEIVDDPTVKAATFVYGETLLNKVATYQNEINAIVQHFHANGWSSTNPYWGTTYYPDEGQYILMFNVNTLGTNDIEVRTINLQDASGFTGITSRYDSSAKYVMLNRSGQKFTYHVTDGVATRDSSYSTGGYIDYWYYGTSLTEDPTLRSVTVEVNDWYYCIDLVSDENKGYTTPFNASTSSGVVNIPLRLKNGSLYTPPTDMPLYKLFKSLGSALEIRYDLEINSVYLVGENRDIWRLTENYSWEILSYAPPVENHILNIESISQTDTYSCEYINNLASGSFFDVVTEETVSDTSAYSCTYMDNKLGDYATQDYVRDMIIGALEDSY